MVVVKQEEEGEAGLTNQRNHHHLDTDDRSQHGTNHDFYPIPSKQASMAQFPVGCPVLYCGILDNDDNNNNNNNNNNSDASCIVQGRVVQVGIDFASTHRENCYKVEFSNACAEQHQRIVRQDQLQLAPRTPVWLTFVVPPNTHCKTESLENSSSSSSHRVKGIVVGSQHDLAGSSLAGLVYSVQVRDAFTGHQCVHWEVSPDRLCFRPTTSYQTPRANKTVLDSSKAYHRNAKSSYLPQERQQQQQRQPPMASLNIPSSVNFNTGNDDMISDELSEPSNLVVLSSSSSSMLLRQQQQQQQLIPNQTLDRYRAGNVQSSGTNGPFSTTDGMVTASDRSATTATQTAMPSATVALKNENFSNSSTSIMMTNAGTTSMANESSPYYSNGGGSALLVNPYPHRFRRIARGRGIHDVSNAVKMLPTCVALPKSVCLWYQFDGECKIGSNCRFAVGHREMDQAEADHLEQLLMPVMGPRGPIKTNDYSGNNTSDARGGAAINNHQNHFENIRRGNHHALMRARDQLPPSIRIRLSNVCFWYQLAGVCGKGSLCPRPGSHKEMTYQEARNLEVMLQSVTGPDGPLKTRKRERPNLDNATVALGNSGGSSNHRRKSEELGKVVNLQPSMFQRIKVGSGHHFSAAMELLRCKSTKDGGPPPLDNYCLSFHLRGYCRTDCPLSNNHHDLAPKQAHEIEVTLWPAMGPDGPIVSESLTLEEETFAEQSSSTSSGQQYRRSPIPEEKCTTNMKAWNTQPNPFTCIPICGEHRVFADSVRKLLGGATKCGGPRSRLDKFCVFFHLQGCCQKGNSCLRADSHKPLTAEEAHYIESALKPVTGPDGPIFSYPPVSLELEVSYYGPTPSSSLMTPASNDGQLHAEHRMIRRDEGAVEVAINEQQPQPFQTIARSTNHKLSEAIDKLERGGSRELPKALKDFCFWYHLQGRCEQGRECDWAANHRDLTPDEAYKIERELTTVVGSNGPLMAKFQTTTATTHSEATT